MKKIVSMLLISAMLCTALTACNTDNKPSDSSNSSTSDGSSDNSTSESTPESSSTESTDSTPENSDSVPENSDSTPEGGDPAPLTSPFKLESCEEFCFSTNVISAQLYKIVIIKPKDGKADEISAAIDKYYEAVQTDPNLAFYPMQQMSAEGAVKGVTDDGYYYMIVHENGETIETALLAAANGETVESTLTEDSVDNSELPFPDNKAGELAKTALITDSWPSMDLVELQEFIDTTFYVAE